jgi:chorismate mutase
MKFRQSGEPQSRSYDIVKECLNEYSIDYLASVVDVLGGVPLAEDDKMNGLAYMSIAAAYLLIPKLDEEMVHLLAERMDVCKEIGRFKKERGLPIFVPEREAEVLRTKVELGKRRGFSPEFTTNLFQIIMDGSKEEQKRV